MNRGILVFCTVLAAALLSGAGQPAPQRLIEFSDAGRAALDRVSAWLNAIQTLKSGFIQIDPNGDLEQGEFYLERPGAMRFEYNPPNPILIVASGGTVTVKNSRLNTLDHYSVSDTPLRLLLGTGIDLKSNRAIVAVDEQPGGIVVHARSSTNRVQSNITLVFSSPNIELRQWTVKDSEGLSTTVALRGVETGVTLPVSLFVAPVKNPPVPKKGG